MEFDSNPPRFRVVFESENEWQRSQVRKVLSGYIDEGEFIYSSERGNVLTTALPGAIQPEDVVEVLCRAAQIAIPGREKPKIDRIKTNHKYL